MPVLSAISCLIVLLALLAIVWSERHRLKRVGFRGFGVELYPPERSTPEETADDASP